jgi:hypothetical protein
MSVDPPSALSFGTPPTSCVLEPLTKRQKLDQYPRVYGTVGTMLTFFNISFAQSIITLLPLSLYLFLVISSNAITSVLVMNHELHAETKECSSNLSKSLIDPYTPLPVLIQITHFPVHPNECA